jgi:transglutaminase-like putative cysteine protease
VPILVQALTPGTDIQRSLAEQWETLRDKLQNAVAGLTSPVVATSDFFGNSMALGAGGTRDEEVVFTVQVNGVRPQNVRFYWKARSYDTYIGSWASSINTSTTVGRSEWPFLYPSWAGRKIVELTFAASANNIRNLYVPAFPLTIDHGADILGKITQAGTLDLIGVLADPSVKSGETFRVRAWVTSPSVNQLNSAPANYSEDMSGYLQLPQPFSPRITNLARQITTGLKSNYDKTVAITNWLRKNITYQESVDTPPTGVDPIEWFLFTYKKGFCNYYASSEVLMLRSLGIPARLAVGYAEGELDEAKNIFTIKRRDSHAWPEVFFEGYGWVEFEPTASQPATILPVELANDPSAGEALTPGIPRDLTAVPPGREDDGLGSEPAATQTSPGTIILAILLVTLGLTVLVLLWLQQRGRIHLLKRPVPVLIQQDLERRGWHVPDWIQQWARLAELSPIERMYARMSWTLPLLGHSTDPSHTPSERLTQMMTVIPEAREQLVVFLKEYQQAEYSPYPFDLEKARQADRVVWRSALRTLFRKLTGQGQPSAGA